MGWNPFASEKVTTVGTSIVRLIDDKNLVDSTKLGVFNGIVSDGDVVDHILEAAANSVATKIRSAYLYAEQHAPYGLPTGTFYGNNRGTEQVTQLLNSIEGSEVFVEYCRMGPMNKLHLAWQTLIGSHGYDPVTNKLGSLTASKKTDVYLADMVLAMSRTAYDSYLPAVLAVWDKPANSYYIPEYRTDFDTFFVPYAASPTVIRSGAEAVIVKYVYKVPVTYTNEDGWGQYTVEEYKKESFEFSLPAIDHSKTYYQVKYGVGNAIKFWSYQVGSGTYFSLDTLLEVLGKPSGQYFPHIYFRLNKTDPNANKADPKYIANSKLAKKLSLNYETLVSQIHENPDIKDVEQAFLTLGIPAESTDPIELMYLYEYWNTQYQSIDTPVQAGFNPVSFMLRGVSNDIDYTYSIEIKDAAFKMQFIHSGIIKQRQIGSIGEKGSYNASVESRELSRTITSSVNDSETTSVIKIPYKVYIYRKQVGINFYDEVTLINPAVKYFIYGQYDNIVGDADKELILVPIDMSLLNPLSVRDKERLISRSMHLVFNSRVVTKVKWYQQSWFGDLLMIAAIVYTAVTLASDGGAGLEAVAALQAGAYAKAALIILTGLAEYVVYTEGFKLFAEAVGADLAFLLAIAAMLYGISEQVEAGTMKLTPTAKDFLSLANGLMGGSSAALNLEMQGLADDFAQFAEIKEEKLEALETAQELLNPTQLLSPYVLFGESPSSYYKRTVHSGNIGSVMIDELHNFHERSLTLPRYA